MCQGTFVLAHALEFLEFHNFSMLQKIISEISEKS